MANDLYDDLKPNMSDEEKKSYLIRVLNDFTDLRSSILGDGNEPYFYIEQTIEDGVLSNTDFINCKGYRYSYDRLDDTEYRKKIHAFMRMELLISYLANALTCLIRWEIQPIM